MAITSGQSKVAVAQSGSSLTITFDNDVTDGNIIVVYVGTSTTSGNTFAAGNLTKSAGTATVGSAVLDKQLSYDPTGMGYWGNVAIFHIEVTGTGSLTLQLSTSSTTGFTLAGHEVPGIDGTVEDTDQGTDDNPGGSHMATGDMVAAGSAYFAGCLAFLCDDTTVAADSGWTELWAEARGSAYFCGDMAYYIEGPVTDAPGWALGTNMGGLCIGVVFSATPGGPSASFDGTLNGASPANVVAGGKTITFTDISDTLVAT